MTSIRDLIDELAQRPGMYVGWWDVHRAHLYLMAFQQGYLAALADGSEAADDTFFDEFEGLVQKEYGTTRVANGKSWACLIEERTGANGSLAEFRRLWDVYKKSKEPSL